MGFDKKREQLYRKFSEAEGNQHIASEHAIRKLTELMGVFRIKKILEVGLGIGSISGTILALTDKEVQYEGTESNDFCLNSLLRNLGADYYKLKVYKDLAAVPRINRYELLIIDGEDGDLKKVEKLISENGIIAIEGDRKPQQELLQKLFPGNRYVHSISLKRNKITSPFPSEEWQGGIKIVFVNPTIKQYFWWLRERTLTVLKYKYPGRYLGRGNSIDGV